MRPYGTTLTAGRCRSRYRCR